MSVEKTPRGWVSCKFGDLAKIRNGYAFKSSSFKNGKELPDDVPLVRQSQLKGSKVDLSEAVYLPVEFLEQFPNYSLKRGDILVGMSGSIGKVCHYETEAVSLQNQRTGKIDLYFEEVVNPRFLALFLSTIERKLMEMAKGMGVQNISAKDIESLPFTLPPLAEQKRMVSKIEELFSELDAGEESLRRARWQLGVYRQSLLKQAFEGKLTAPWRKQNPHLLESPDHLLARIEEERESSGNSAATSRASRKRSSGIDLEPGLVDSLPKLPVSWRWIALGNLTSLITKGSSPKWQGFDYTDDASGLLFITSENVRSGFLDLERPKYLGLGFNKSQAKSVLQDGDVLLNIVGASIGRAAVFHGDVVANINQAVALIRLTESLDRKLLTYHLNSAQTYQLVTSKAVDVARANFSLADVNEIPVPLCSLPEQREIVRLLDEQFTVIEQNEREIDAALKRSAALRQSILKKAFTGQLVPQDPTDEPASALLERIRKERETASGNRKTVEKGRRPIRERRGR